MRAAEGDLERLVASDPPLTKREILLVEQRAAFWRSCQEACLAAVLDGRNEPKCLCCLLDPLPDELNELASELYREMNS